MTSSDEILLSIEGLTVSYGAVQAVRGIDLTVKRGEIVTLLGANGAGKSSTLNALVGLAPRKARRMQFEGNDLLGLPPETIVRRGMTLVPEGRRVFSSLTVDENLILGGSRHAGRGNPAAVKADMLELFPILAERLHQKAGSLSGRTADAGHRARADVLTGSAAAGRTLAWPRPQVVDRIFDLIVNLRDRGLTILLVEQNVVQSLEIADRGYVLANGRVELQGSAADLRASPEIQDAYLGA